MCRRVVAVARMQSKTQRNKERCFANTPAREELSIVAVAWFNLFNYFSSIIIEYYSICFHSPGFRVINLLTYFSIARLYFQRLTLRWWISTVSSSLVVNDLIESHLFFPYNFPYTLDSFFLLALQSTCNFLIWNYRLQPPLSNHLTSFGSNLLFYSEAIVLIIMVVTTLFLVFSLCEIPLCLRVCVKEQSFILNWPIIFIKNQKMSWHTRA